MKKLSMLLVLALVATMLAVPAFAEGTTYTQAPMLDSLVDDGTLPPVEERLPEEPFVVEPGAVAYAEYFEDYQIGKYGGTLKSVRNSTTWDGWIWCILGERAIESVSGEEKDFYANVFKDWEVNEDFTTYTFYLRKGLRWSDGEELTTEDVQWKFEMDHSNTQLTANWPNWIRTGNKATGTPCTWEIIDDYTFSLTFDGSYPGFLICVAGQDVYEFVAPAHYLKDFHIDTADIDELTAKCEAGGYTIEQWFSLYELWDYSSWDCAAENQIPSPSLGAWLLKSMEGTTGVYERNPYYWKVDAAGQQLPYADGMTSTYCVDNEAIAVKILGGEVDYTYEWVPMDQIGLFAENAESAGIKLQTKPILHRTGGDIIFNWTYHDDNWREVVAMYDFRAAISYALDKEEIVDTVYFGFAEPATVTGFPDYDPAKAAELLDGIGMTVGEDGYRTYPNGDPCVIELCYSSWMTTYEPLAVLVSEYLQDINLNIQMKFVDNDLMSTLAGANDLQMCIFQSHGPVKASSTEFVVDYNACLYWQNYNTNGATGEQPNEIFDKWYKEYMYAAYSVGPEQVREKADAKLAYFKDNLLYITPCQNIVQPSAISTRLRNFPGMGGYNLDDCRSSEDCWIDE